MDEAQAIIAPPELTPDMDPQKLVEFCLAYIKKAESYFNAEDGKNLKRRRERNKRFIFGRQLEADKRIYRGVAGDRALKTYEKAVIDNVIKEGESTLRPMILSRLPDIIVNPGTMGNEQSQKSADDITKVVNKALTSRDIKKVFSKSLRHLPVYLTGVIKYYWDPNKGKFGDIVYECIHPDNILVDSTATENDERSMKIIVHYVEKSIKDWIFLFPKKENEIMEFARSKGVFTNSLTEESFAANLKIPEIWYDYKEKEAEFDPENPKFKIMSGVCWIAGKTKDAVLDNRLNPNWDWEGTEELFFNGEPIPTELLPQIAMLGMNVPGIERRQVFRNFFGRPRKPFIFLGYEQWGEMAYDETSFVEENLLLQENYDTRGMQITNMIDESRGKHIFSTMSGLKKATIEEMDLGDPDEDVVVEGDLRQVHSFISKEQPSAAMFNDQALTRERILAKMKVHGASRGEIQTDTATTTQIARESDFTSADDIADDTINTAATQMAEALLHIMKLRYTPDHFKVVLGKTGERTFIRFTHDIIEDGMEVEIFASGTDKLRAERQAQADAANQLIDPLTYYKDTGRSDPEGRAEKLFIQQTNPELYYKKFIKGEELPEIAAEAVGSSQAALNQVQGTAPTTPTQPSPTNPTNIPTTPAGSPRNLIGRAGQTISKLFGK
jgi:hypothetical protein